MRKILYNLNLNIEIQTRVLRFYVCWTYSEATFRHLQEFEMWCYRRMMRMSYVHHVNQTVLDEMNKEREKLTRMKVPKASYFGHVMRNSKWLLQLFIHAKIEGKRTTMQRLSWLKYSRLDWNDRLYTVRSAVNAVKCDL